MALDRHRIYRTYISKVFICGVFQGLYATLKMGEVGSPLKIHIEECVGVIDNFARCIASVPSIPLILE